tara:strand:+ start:1564 stop:1860 length:297 start_codon:yes stop_codon:yes gene_type:complete
MTLEGLGLNYYITTLFLFLFIFVCSPVLAGEGQELPLIKVEDTKEKQFSEEVIWLNYIKGNELKTLNVEGKDAIFTRPEFLTDKENEKQFKKCTYKRK